MMAEGWLVPVCCSEAQEGLAAGCHRERKMLEGQ